MDEPHIDRHDPHPTTPLTSPALPGVQGAHPVCGVQDDRPPVWRRQLVDSAASHAAIGRREDGAECKLSIECTGKKHACTPNPN